MFHWQNVLLHENLSEKRVAVLWNLTKYCNAIVVALEKSIAVATRIGNTAILITLAATENFCTSNCGSRVNLADPENGAESGGGCILWQESGD